VLFGQNPFFGHIMQDHPDISMNHQHAMAICNEVGARLQFELRFVGLQMPDRLKQLLFQLREQESVAGGLRATTNVAVPPAA
jgi:hypothetical protein